MSLNKYVFSFLIFLSFQVKIIGYEGGLSGYWADKTGYAYFIKITEDGDTISPTGAGPKGRSSLRGSAVTSAKNFLVFGSEQDSQYAAIIDQDTKMTEITDNLFPKYGGFLSCGDISDSTIVLGGSNSRPYAAIYSESVGCIELTKHLEDPYGQILSVAVNNWGNGIIGGIVDDKSYVALFTADGTLTEVADACGLEALIKTVDINDSGDAIIGGTYTALIKDGVLKELSVPPETRISSVAINDSGNAIIGGEINKQAYAALVLEGRIEALSVPVEEGAFINSVAINNSGNGIIGGSLGGTGGYAALISSEGVSLPLSNLPQGWGYLYSVAINSSGYAMIGGKEQDSYGKRVAWAKFVSPEGSLIDISGSKFPTSSFSEIYSVRITD